MARRFEGKVQVIGLGGRDELKAMRAFVERHELGDVPHVADVSGALWRQLGVQGQPTWIFVDDDGTVERHFGVLGEKAFAAKVEALISK